MESNQHLPRLNSKRAVELVDLVESRTSFSNPTASVPRTNSLRRRWLPCHVQCLNPPVSVHCAVGRERGEWYREEQNQDRLWFPIR
ncbi:hypothetical protein Nepgr_000162 [Nepenthes gracilis]|uniref:Uncharacterized protein n=1 Tax=Nepenthes gracilis TaxID=150966 RepID=A0AAD3RWL2_NEPGR|nr:hypothetical protein Nepgr_000162 [Nepenthes gracilis]